ncbi:MAG: hypothetical protein ACRDZ4_17260 [Egibacteraceae bacterium]
MTARLSAPLRWSGEAGAVGGFEAIPFGVLIFVLGTLLVANAWALIDAKFAVAAAAREAARAFVEADPAADPVQEARTAAEAALAAYGRDPSRMRLDHAGEFARCERVSVTVTYPVPVVVLPGLTPLGRGLEATSTYSEIVDPLRSGLKGEATCVGG